MSGGTKICFATLQPISARAFLVPLMEELHRRGCEVHLLTSPKGADEAVDFAGVPFCRVHRVSMPRGIAPVADALAVWRLACCFRRERFAIVHAHMSKCASLVLPAARLARVRVPLYTNHGMAWMSAAGARRRMLRGVERFSCRLAQRVYFVSFSNRDDAVGAGLLGQEKAAVLAHGSICGVEADEFAPTPARIEAGRLLRAKLGIAPRALVVAHVGRAVRHKGYHATAGMWVRHFSDNPEFHLLLVGSSARDFGAATGAPLPRNVSVVEWTDDMAACYAASDVVVMPSLHEGLGYTLLEAGAAERPVIGSRISGIVDAIEGERTGLFVPAGDGDALAAAVCRLRADPSLRERLGRGGAERVRARYPRREVCRAFGEEYERLLGGRRSGH